MRRDPAMRREDYPAVLLRQLPFWGMTIEDTFQILHHGAWGIGEKRGRSTCITIGMVEHVTAVMQGMVKQEKKERLIRKVMNS